MWDFIVLGLIPGTHYQINFQMALGMWVIAIGIVWAYHERHERLARKRTEARKNTWENLAH